MPAGDSAAEEAARQRALAEAHEKAAVAARERAVNFEVAAGSEKRIARVLAPLAAAGYHFLPDRGWPGSRGAQVDMIVVGPGGVFIVDTKQWAELEIAAGHVYRGQVDVTDEFDRLADLAWKTEAVLAEVGLAPGEVRPTVVFAGKKGIKAQVGTVDLIGEADVIAHIAKRGRRLSASNVDVVFAAAMRHFPPVGAPAPIATTIPEPVLGELPPQSADDLPTAEEVEEVMLESLMAEPIEDWMVFLHPDQAKLVRRTFNGPSRIRGAAGTGKTVVGLHRAAYLARTRPEGKVLVTTFINTLPTVLSNLLARLAPDVAERVEFISVHRFARRLLDQRGIAVRLDPKAAEAAFEAAWRTASDRLVPIEKNKSYWHEELEYVIKGRGLTTFEQYLDCARTGRRRQLGVNQKRAVWDLYQRYDDGLRAAQVHDFADQILLAERSLAEQPLEGYSAVIVDEAQDLSCAMVRMLAVVGGGGPDGFTLIGDGQQAIYPGGYSLAEAGISVAGRGVVMETNYRNTAEVLAAAENVVAGSTYTDIEGVPTAASVPSAARHGKKPEFLPFSSRADHDHAMVERVRVLSRTLDVGLGDIAVLCATRSQVEDALRIFASADIPAMALTDYDGRTTDAVKVGTIKRSKGLEFKQVLLPWVSPRLRMRRDALVGATDSMLERDDLDRRELFVGITRARDEVWVGSHARPYVSRRP